MRKGNQRPSAGYDSNERRQAAPTPPTAVLLFAQHIFSSPPPAAQRLETAAVQKATYQARLLPSSPPTFCVCSRALLQSRSINPDPLRFSSSSPASLPPSEPKLPRYIPRFIT
ncbi:unnamed protein product [Ectocarpus sp. 6 AP-2014]